MDPSVSENKKAEVLTWVHHHLMAPGIIEFDSDLVRPRPLQEAVSEMVEPSLDRNEIVRLLLSGTVGIDENLGFRLLVPPPGPELVVACIVGDAVPPAKGALAAERVAWLHRRLTHTAQRTRFHQDWEIKAMLEWADAEFIKYAVRMLEFGRYLEKPPIFERVPVEPILIAWAARGYSGVDWTPEKPFFIKLGSPSVPTVD